MIGEITASRLFIGLKIKKAYESKYDGTNFIKLVPCQYSFVNSRDEATNTAHAVKLLYSASFIVEDDEQAIKVVNTYDAKVNTCLAVIIKHPYTFFAIDEKKADGTSLEIEVEWDADWRWWRRYHQIPVVRMGEYVVMEEEDVDRWISLCSKLITQPSISDTWFTALRWLNRCYSADNYADAMVAAYTAFTALSQRIRRAAKGQKKQTKYGGEGEMEATKRFINNNVDESFRSDYFSRNRHNIEQLANVGVTTVGRDGTTDWSKKVATSLGNIDRAAFNVIDKQMPEKRQVVVDALAACAVIRNNIMHTSSTYENKEYEGEVKIALYLTSNFVRELFFQQLLGEVPAWRFATVHATFAWGYNIDFQ